MSLGLFLWKATRGQELLWRYKLCRQPDLINVTDSKNAATCPKCKNFMTLAKQLYLMWMCHIWPLLNKGWIGTSLSTTFLKLKSLKLLIKQKCKTLTGFTAIMRISCFYLFYITVNSILVWADFHRTQAVSFSAEILILPLWFCWHRWSSKKQCDDHLGLWEILLVIFHHFVLL